MKFIDFMEHTQIFDIRGLPHSFVDEGTSLLGHFASLIGDISEGGVTATTSKVKQCEKTV